MKIKNEDIDIRFDYLVPWHFRLVGVALVIVAIAGFMVNPLLAILFIAVGVFLVTSYSGTVLNRSNNTYKEYNTYFFIKSADEQTHSGIEKIFINPGKLSQKIYTAHTLNSQTFENVIYNAYIKFNNGEKIQLLQSKDKAKLMKELDAIAEFMNTSIQDNT